MGIVNLAIRFLVELVGAAFVGYWGFATAGHSAVGIEAGIVVAAVFVGFWGRVLAPKASSGLSSSQKLALGTVVLLVAAVAVAAAGQPTVALVYAAVVVANAALLAVMGERPLEELAAAPNRR